MKKTLARWGAVGGTARWVADCFMKAVPNIDKDNLKSNEGKIIELDKIVDFCLQVRGTVMPQYEVVEVKACYDVLHPGMISFTIALLAVEAGYFDNSAENQKMFREIIKEELTKKGVGKIML
tara:strand:- start:229 stop:594 length:366 start_codon:yes stop_codon:yes gene_type:complete